MSWLTDFMSAVGQWFKGEASEHDVGELISMFEARKAASTSDYEAKGWVKEE